MLVVSGLSRHRVQILADMLSEKGLFLMARPTNRSNVKPDQLENGQTSGYKAATAALSGPQSADS
jgi:hypothetical protein